MIDREAILNSDDYIGMEIILLLRSKFFEVQGHLLPIKPNQVIAVFGNDYERQRALKIAKELLGLFVDFLEYIDRLYPDRLKIDDVLPKSTMTELPL